MLRVCLAVALAAALLAAESRGAESPAIRRVAETFPNDNNLSVILDVDPINML